MLTERDLSQVVLFMGVNDYNLKMVLMVEVSSP